MAAITKITGDDIYELMTSPAMEPTLMREGETGDVVVRAAIYATDFPERYEPIISREDAIASDQSGDYNGEDAPDDDWCAMVAEFLNDDTR